MEKVEPLCADAKVFRFIDPVGFLVVTPPRPGRVDVYKEEVMPHSNNRNDPEYKWKGFSVTDTDMTANEPSSISILGPDVPGPVDVDVDHEAQSNVGPDVPDANNFIRSIGESRILTVSAADDDNLDIVWMVEYVQNMNNWDKPGLDAAGLATSLTLRDVLDFGIVGGRADSTTNWFVDTAEVEFQWDISSTRVLQENSGLILSYEVDSTAAVGLQTLGRNLLRVD